MEYVTSLHHPPSPRSRCLQIPEGHRERMLLAELSFFWHRVYDPRSKTCVHFCSAAPELVGTEEVPALSSASGGTAFLGWVHMVDRSAH